MEGTEVTKYREVIKTRTEEYTAYRDVKKTRKESYVVHEPKLSFSENPKTDIDKVKEEAEVEVKSKAEAEAVAEADIGLGSNACEPGQYFGSVIDGNLTQGCLPCPNGKYCPNGINAKTCPDNATCNSLRITGCQSPYSLSNNQQSCVLVLNKNSTEAEEDFVEAGGAAQRAAAEALRHCIGNSQNEDQRARCQSQAREAHGGALGGPSEDEADEENQGNQVEAQAEVLETQDDRSECERNARSKSEAARCSQQAEEDFVEAGGDRDDDLNEVRESAAQRAAVEAMRDCVGDSQDEAVIARCQSQAREVFTRAGGASGVINERETDEDNARQQCLRSAENRTQLIACEKRGELTNAVLSNAKVSQIKETVESDWQKASEDVAKMTKAERREMLMSLREKNKNLSFAENELSLRKSRAGDWGATNESTETTDENTEEFDWHDEDIANEIDALSQAASSAQTYEEKVAAIEQAYQVVAAIPNGTIWSTWNASGLIPWTEYHNSPIIAAAEELYNEQTESQQLIYELAISDANTYYGENIAPVKEALDNFQMTQEEYTEATAEFYEVYEALRAAATETFIISTAGARTLYEQTVEPVEDEYDRAIEEITIKRDNLLQQAYDAREAALAALSPSE